MRLLRTEQAFVDHSYPATTTELIADYGDDEIALPNGTETVGETLDRQGEETFENFAVAS
jgi:hypothetical protein